MKVQIEEKDIRHRRLQMRFGRAEIAEDLQPLQRRAQDRFHAACQVAGDHRFILHHDRSEEHTSELQSLMRISYAVFCLKKKKTHKKSYKVVSSNNDQLNKLWVEKIV